MKNVKPPFGSLPAHGYARKLGALTANGDASGTPAAMARYVP